MKETPQHEGPCCPGCVFEREEGIAPMRKEGDCCCYASMTPEQVAAEWSVLTPAPTLNNNRRYSRKVGAHDG